MTMTQRGKKGDVGEAINGGEDKDKIRTATGRRGTLRRRSDDEKTSTRYA